MDNLIDILAFAAHPDDVELAASGTLLAHKALGQKIGIIDLTAGELGTRGSATIRKKEAKKSAEILELDYRKNLGLKDGFFEINEESLLKVIKEIRLLQPKVVLANAITDRHPDHGQAAKLVAKAFFLSGLVKIETNYNGVKQKPFRPKQLLHYIQDQHISPDIVFDISRFIDKKKEAINAFSTQFHQGNKTKSGPTTPISGQDFMPFLEGRARDFGRTINVEFGEGFTTSKPVSIDDFLKLL
jgi:bacillithiol biosynthesis deacetylase BshB1